MVQLEAIFTKHQEPILPGEPRATHSWATVAPGRLPGPGHCETLRGAPSGEQRGQRGADGEKQPQRGPESGNRAGSALLLCEQRGRGLVCCQRVVVSR